MGWRSPVRRARWIGILGLAWFLLVVAGYFILHKPFPRAVAESAGACLVDFLAAVAILSVAGGLGRRIAPGAHAEPLAAVAVQASLGLALLSLGVLTAGLIGILWRGVAWAALALMLLLLRKEIRFWLLGLREGIRRMLPATGFERAIASLVLVMLGASLAESLAPPSHFDALVYHLSLPREFLAGHAVRMIPDNPYWGMPLGAEMLYTWAMALGRAQSAAVLGWGIGLAALVGVLGLGALFGRTAGWVGVAAILAGETLAGSLGWAYADWLAALHGIALLILIDAYRREPDTGRAALAGVAAGAAFGTKYTAGLAFLAGGVALLTVTPRRRAGRALLAFAATAALLGAPWLMRNWLIAGAPLYPFVQPTRWVSAIRLQFYAGEGISLSPIAFLAPFAAPLLGVEGAPGFAASLGPLMLGLLAGLPMLRRPHRLPAVPILSFVATGWLAWVLGGLYSAKLVQSRLYYVIYPGWAVLSGAAFASLGRLRIARVRFSQLAKALVLLVLIASGLTSALRVLQSRPLGAALGLESSESYLARRLGGYSLAMQEVTALGPRSLVLMLWEPRGFACRPGCLPAYWLDQWYVDRRALGDPATILEAWRERGVTHVLFNRSGAAFVRADDQRYTSEDWIALDSLLASLQPIERIGDGYELYRMP